MNDETTIKIPDGVLIKAPPLIMKHLTLMAHRAGITNRSLAIVALDRYLMEFSEGYRQEATSTGPAERR